MKIMRETKGITLIALVITIIVLLILAGVAISMLSGENGILNQAANAKTETAKKSAEEQVKLAVMDALMRGNDLTSIESVSDLNAALASQGLDVEATGSAEAGYIVEVDGIKYTISSKGKLSEIPDSLLAYVEMLKTEKGGEANFDTIVVTFEGNDYTAKGFNFTYDGNEYTYILEAANLSGYGGAINGAAEVWEVQKSYGATSSYDIKDKMVVELQGNPSISSGWGLDMFEGVILPDTMTFLYNGIFRGNSTLQELKINGIIENNPTATGTSFNSTCRIFYQGEEYTGTEFLKLFLPKWEEPVEVTADSLIEAVEKLKVELGGESAFDTISAMESTAYHTYSAKGFNFKYNGNEYTYILESKDLEYANDGSVSYYSGTGGGTISYSVKDRIVVEYQNGTELTSGNMLDSWFAGVILPESIIDIDKGGVFFGGTVLEELKINGTITTLNTSEDYIKFNSTCTIHYQGNKYTGAEFLALFE